ncbi:hypothetical protein FIBSPDRAFT_886946 [Athelia psychrophila]|uniref:Uncharacterized protein n=1 Tax=Athelia psychrophila TaxID=1759441 RepID=A0A166Q3Y0_9AGAM|nr:hypothetical protein FIBSPDRAFT_886946 [Fibularhizoctonia sp. CBS 109695]
MACSAAADEVMREVPTVSPADSEVRVPPEPTNTEREPTIERRLNYGDLNRSYGSSGGSSVRQELHSYLQSIYRNSDVLDIPVREVARGVWRADVLINGLLVAQGARTMRERKRPRGRCCNIEGGWTACLANEWSFWSRARHFQP